MARGSRTVYEGNPEFWSVLDESFPKEQRLRKQLEVRDVRLQRLLFEQTERVLGGWAPEAVDNAEKDLPTTKYNEFQALEDGPEEQEKLRLEEEDLENLEEIKR